ncbi:MAG: hypothetical protein IT204_23575 [Fimbriimonadaceae bacterium]|nr:hypothetical protein [Fimbriimonadaceae bacterium]
MNHRLAALLQPLEQVAHHELGDLCGAASLRLLLRAAAERTLASLPAGDTVRLGLDPYTDRAFRRAWCEAFCSGAGQVLGGNLPHRLAQLRQALEECIVPA